MSRFIVAAVCMALTLCHGDGAHTFSHCADGCPENAACVDNKCECLLGYAQELSFETGLPYCRSLCAVPCMPKSNCVAPDRCECIAGHELDALGSACVPVRSTTPPPLRRTTHVESTAMSSTTEALRRTSSAKYSDVDSEDANDEEYSGAGPIVTQARSTAKPKDQATDRCPPDYIYEEGGCRPLIRTTDDPQHYVKWLDVSQNEQPIPPPQPNNRSYYVWIGVSLVVLAVAVMVVCIAHKSNE